MGGWTLMEMMWKILFGLLLARWPSCVIGINTNVAGAIRAEHKPEGLCSKFVEPYYSKYECHEYSVRINLVELFVEGLVFLRIFWNSNEMGKQLIWPCMEF